MADRCIFDRTAGRDITHSYITEVTEQIKVSFEARAISEGSYLDVAWRGS